MSRAFVHYVGRPEEIGHHADPLRAHLAVHVAPLEQVLSEARPGDVAVLVSEFFQQQRDAVAALKARGLATLYAIDGVLEWRLLWDNADDEEACPWTMRPCLCDRIAVIGPSQARALAAWGNADRLEFVGVPRFDFLLSQIPPSASVHHHLRNRDTLRVLVMTAKCPGFTPAQRARTLEALRDLKAYFTDEPRASHPPCEVTWRLTAGLDRELNVGNQLRDTTGSDLRSTLANVDLVISTPSTAILEAMAAGKPTATLDYHNVPELVPTAWRISSRQQIETTLSSMAMRDLEGEALSQRRLAWQYALLADSLWLSPGATQRLARLLEQMHEIASAAVASGRPIEFPAQPLLAESPVSGRHPIGEPFHPAWLFPDQPDLSRDDLWALQSELAQSRREVRRLTDHLARAHRIFDEIENHPIAGPIVRLRQRWLDWRHRLRQSRDQRRSARSPS